MINDDALSAEEVGSMLKVSRKMVYELANSGKLPFYKIGRRMRFDRADIEKYLAGARVVGGPQEGQATDEATEQTSARDASDDSFVLAGQGIAADMFIDRLELMGEKATRCLRSSYRGLIELYEGEVDATLTHLYDQGSNTYNIPYVKTLVPGVPVVVFRLVRRKQGFAVAPGNPKKITTWGALLHDGVRLANRSKGCGSRVLLDEKLTSMEADHRVIAGYDSDYTTGLAAADAVAKGIADVAVIGEQIAAHAEGIQFVPLQHEWLDIVVAKTDRGRQLARKLRSLFADKSFREEYGRIVHGDTDQFGSIVYEN